MRGLLQVRQFFQSSIFSGAIVLHSFCSVSAIPGKPAGYGQEVLVQGKQIKAVTDYLLGKGIPKKWIESADLSGKK